MGIVNRIASTLRAPAEAVLRYASDDDVFILGGEPSNDAGDHRPASDLPGATSVYRAMSPVYKGVQFRSNALAQIPLELVDAEGQPTRPTHPVAAALRLMDQFAVLRDTEADLLIHGRAYWLCNTTGGGLTLEYVPAGIVTNPTKGSTLYRIDDITVEADRIIHFYGYTPSGYVGRSQYTLSGYGGQVGSEVSPVGVILESARLAHWNRGSNVVAQRAFASVRRYIIGADQRNPGGQDTVETMSESEMTALHDWLRGVRYADDDTEREKPLAARHNALIRGRPTALAIGGRNDPEFTAMQTWFVQEAARALSVPPPLLDDLSRATYANVRDLVRHWYMSTLTANLKFYENLLTRRLCATNLDAIGLRIAFDTSDVEELQPDRMQTTQRVIQEYNARLVTYEEAREQLGYDPDVMVESPQQPEPEPPEDDAS